MMTPDLAPAAAEIEAVLKKHNLVGLIIVSNETHADWIMSIDRDWTCCHFEGEFLRVRTPKDKPIKERMLFLRNTIATFSVFVDIMEKMHSQLMGLMQAISQHGVQIFAHNKDLGPGDQPPGGTQ